MPLTTDGREVKRPAVLLTGGSGYVGGRLLPLLEAKGVALRCLARNPAKLRPVVAPTTEILEGDVLDPSFLNVALQGVETAYYLIHLMADSTDFEREDRQAATNFARSGKEGRCSTDHLSWRIGRRQQPKSVAAPSQPARGREDPARERRGMRRVPSLSRDWSGESLLRSRPFPHQPLAGHDLPSLAHNPNSADRGGRRAGLSVGRHGSPDWTKPHLRDWRHGCRHLRRHHSRIRPAAKAATMVDLGARAYALSLQSVVGACYTSLGRSGSASDRGAQKSDRRSRSIGSRRFSDSTDGHSRGNFEGACQSERVIRSSGPFLRVGP